MTTILMNGMVGISVLVLIILILPYVIGKICNVILRSDSTDSNSWLIGSFIIMFIMLVFCMVCIIGGLMETAGISLF